MTQPIYSENFIKWILKFHNKIKLNTEGDTFYPGNKFWNFNTVQEMYEFYISKVDEPEDTKRKMFDEFYEWLDGLTPAEYDDMSLTDTIEIFFFDKQPKV